MPLPCTDDSFFTQLYLSLFRSVRISHGHVLAKILLNFGKPGYAVWWCDAVQMKIELLNKKNKTGRIYVCIL